MVLYSPMAQSQEMTMLCVNIQVSSFTQVYFLFVSLLICHCFTNTRPNNKQPNYYNSLEAAMIARPNKLVTISWFTQLLGSKSEADYTLTSYGKSKDFFILVTELYLFNELQCIANTGGQLIPLRNIAQECCRLQQPTQLAVQ